MRQNKAQTKRLKRQKRASRVQKQAKRRQLQADKLVQKLPLYREPNEWLSGSNPFPSDMPLEKRRELLMRVVEKAKKEFDGTLLKIQSLFNEFDSCYLLSFYAYYFMRSKEGTSHEYEGDFKHYQHYVEVLQVLALTKPRILSVRPLRDRAKEFEQLLCDLGEYTQFKHMDIKQEDTEESIGRQRTIMQVRNQTTAVRNWAYYSQMEKVTLDIMKLISSEFKGRFGVKAEDVAALFFNIPQLINIKAQAHDEKIRSFYTQKDRKSVMRSYEEQFPDVAKTNDQSLEALFNGLDRSIKKLKHALWSHADLRLQNIFTITLDEAAKSVGDADKDSLRAILDQLSYEFDDLKAQNLDRIILDNPILKRPFIKLDVDTYFCPAGASMPHFAMEIMENLVSSDTALSKRLSDAKADYTENFVSDILATNFPSATIYKKIKWQRSDMKGTEFETDNLLVAGSFALVLESKSGKFTPQARRGAEDRLQKHVDDLVLNPSRQANNLIDAIKNDKLAFVKDSTGRRIKLNVEGVRYYIPISITLENLGMLSSPREIVEAGMNKGMLPKDINSCMTMTDLECIFALLPYEAMKLHYLVRKREFVMHVDTTGDEMDFLGFYLERGFNIGQTEYDAKLHMDLTLVSENVDKYFMLQDVRHVQHPPSYLTPQWKGLLKSLEERKPEAWLEASFALLNCDAEDQQDFAKKVTKFIADFENNSLSGYPKEPAMVFVTGPEKRQIAIVIYPYRNISKEDRNEGIASFMNDKLLNNCKIKLAFGIDVDRLHLPYAVMAVSKDSVLIEEPMEFIESDMLANNKR